MKVLVSWLSDYVETGLSAEEIAEILSDLGFPNEGIEHLNNDAVIDLEVTSNRGDCLGYIGVARELAAATGKELKLPKIELIESDKDVNGICSVQIGEPELCGRYTARVIEDVTVGPSPEWIRSRLEAIGMRSVNNVVDATNYAMMETGQPPHAFDYAKIKEGKIIVRKARAGERIISIDGSKCELMADMLVIADAREPVAVAGVMGGLETEVGDNTKTILLEEAYFSPVSVRSTSRALALPSEAAFRFERIVDIANIEWASKRTAQLIVQVAGGRAAKGIVDVYPAKSETKKVAVRLSRINHLLGIDVPADEAINILQRLNFEPAQNGDVITCSVPTWRSDVYREADLIEEVARHYGFNKVPVERKIEIEVRPVDERQKLYSTIGKFLNGCGFYETVNVSFVEDEAAEIFGQAGERGHLSVKDVTRRSANLLRSSLLGSLAEVAKINANAGNRPMRVFEIADTFIPSGDKLPIERTKLAILCDSDMRDLRGVAEGVISCVAKDATVEFKAADVAWARAGAKILVNGQEIGEAGVMSDAAKAKYDLEEVPICAAEVDFDSLQQMKKQDVMFSPLPRFPAIDRDLSLLIDEAVKWEDIIIAINQAGCEKLEQVQFVGIYRGKGVEAGKKSLTLTLRFRDEDGTLTHEQVDEFQEKIFGCIAGQTGAVLRTA
ncbi:MAG: phenylalanine--tRNA ligase subunit beta [Phycisphaerae bacterium]|jgi:phenylalanyl-tRNA synthetase beta chain